MKEFYSKAAAAHLSVFFTFFIVASVDSQTTGSAPMLGSYFDLLATGNYESAGYMWNRQAQDRSVKLGIKYENIPLKVDCVSPIVQNLNVMKNFLQPPVKRFESLMDGKYQKLYFSAVVQGEGVEHVYFAEYDGKYYWLTYPQDIYGAEWPVRESEYFRVHIDPEKEKFLNSSMFEEADRFVEQMADTLGISKMDLRHLQSVKIEFYYCATDDQVEEITGQRTRGLYDKASSDIISSFFPHHHEVVHLLVDYSLKELPLFIHPLFEEGAAVYYGGRWGKSAESLMPLGIYLYEQGLVVLDSLLSYQTFKNSAEADIAYPLAALFNQFVMERAGKQKYFALYRKFGGTAGSLMELSVDSVKARLLRTVSSPNWEDFTGAFGKFLESYKRNFFVVMPGSTGHGENVINSNTVIVRSNNEWLEFEFITDENPEPKGNLLFGKDKNLANVNSAMFTEHYGEKMAYEGYRYGVRFDANEAGLYDYFTNTLLAKYIAVVSPSEDYFNAADHKIAVRIKKSLTNGIVPSENDYKLLNF